MMKANENARIEQLRKLLRPWPGYDVIGNRPYAKGCYLIRKAHIENGAYRLPEVVASTERNYDMLIVIESPDFHPSRAHQLIDSAEGTLFPLTPQDFRPLRRRLLAKAVELIDEGMELANLFLYDETLATRSVNEAMGELRALWKELR